MRNIGTVLLIIQFSIIVGCNRTHDATSDLPDELRKHMREVQSQQAQLDALRQQVRETVQKRLGKANVTCSEMHVNTNGTAVLVFTNGEIADLAPLKELPLQGLVLKKCLVTDLSPLREKDLEIILLEDVPVRDLSPLSGMNSLTTLRIKNTRVEDLSSLQGLQLTYLHSAGSPVHDLSPLRGMPIATLNILGTKVSDVSPLLDMPLELIGLPVGQITNGIDLLRDVQTLKKLVTDTNACWTPEEFWKNFDAGEFLTEGKAEPEN